MGAGALLAAGAALAGGAMEAAALPDGADEDVEVELPPLP
jgi:hypothetical protein